MLFASLNRSEDSQTLLQNIGLTQEEMSSLFTGDISLAITDYVDISKYDPRVAAEVRREIASSGEDADAEAYSLKTPLAYISIGEANDTAANQLLEDLGLVKMGNAWAVPGLDLIIYAAAKDGHLLVTNDFYAADSLAVNGKMSGTLPQEISRRDNFTGWLDLDQSHFPKELVSPEQPGYVEDLVAAALVYIKPFRSVRMQATPAGSKLEISVVPGEGNSLTRLITYYATLR
jgi:hypothetical protein